MTAEIIDFARMKHKRLISKLRRKGVKHNLTPEPSKKEFFDAALQDKFIVSDPE